jgi:translation initiation factor 3 subunit E
MIVVAVQLVTKFLFCHIHQCSSINSYEYKLNMTLEEAESWIVNLIRNARLDAKIDSKLDHVFMVTMQSHPISK